MTHANNEKGIKINPKEKWAVLLRHWIESYAVFVPSKRSVGGGWGVCCGNALDRYQTRPTCTVCRAHCAHWTKSFYGAPCTVQHTPVKSAQLSILFTTGATNSHLLWIAQVIFWYLKESKRLRRPAQKRHILRVNQFLPFEIYMYHVMVIHHKHVTKLSLLSEL